MRNTLLLFLVFAFALSLFPNLCSAKRASKTLSVRELQREQRRLQRFMQRASKRAGEVQFLASRLQFLQRAMNMASLGKIQQSAQGLTQRLRDRRLKSLVVAYLSSVDGTPNVTEREKETFLRLTFELESSLGEMKKAGKRMREIQMEMANIVPPPMKRRMMRQITQLMQVSKSKKKMVERAETLELEAELELEACRLEPSRSRKKLRELRGEVVVARKKIEFFDAQLALGEALKEALADNCLSSEERKRLTKYQMAFNQLRHTLDGLKTARY